CDRPAADRPRARRAVPAVDRAARRRRSCLHRGLHADRDRRHGDRHAARRALRRVRVVGGSLDGGEAPGGVAVCAHGCRHGDQRGGFGARRVTRQDDAPGGRRGHCRAPGGDPAAVLHGFVGAVGSYAIASQLLYTVGLMLAAHAMGAGMPSRQGSVVSLGAGTRNLGAALAPLLVTPPDPRTMVMVALAVPITLALTYGAAIWLAEPASSKTPS